MLQVWMQRVLDAAGFGLAAVGLVVLVLGARDAVLGAPGTRNCVLHFGQVTTLPAAVAPTRSFVPQLQPIIMLIATSPCLLSLPN